MKEKEMKGQMLSFAHAQSGMNGVKFKNISNANEFWKNQILEMQSTEKAVKTEATENQINKLLSMFK